jgi:hypothetical protein
MALALEGRTRVVWDALLTGVPFGIFKMGTGYFLWTFQGMSIAVLLIAWGIVDLGLNLVAAFWPRPLPYCLLSAFGRSLDRLDILESNNRFEPILLAVDSLLSFVLISGMIWFHAIPELGFPLSRIWEFAVVCQVMGVGISRVLYVIQNPVNS